MRFPIRFQRGFTLLELVIVIGLIAILVVGTLLLLNPTAQIAKTNDAKRKSELANLKRIFEDFSTDNNHYPIWSQVCKETSDPGNCQCHICATRTLNPYASQLPCDPHSPLNDYLYTYDCAAGGNNPSWYRIYAKLDNKADPAITQVGCQNGCGPASAYAYNYYVTSPNIGPEINPIQIASTPTPTPNGSPPTSTPIPTATPAPTATPGPSPTPTPNMLPSPTPTTAPGQFCSSYVNFNCVSAGLCNACGSEASCLSSCAFGADTNLYIADPPYSGCNTPCIK